MSNISTYQRNGTYIRENKVKQSETLFKKIDSTVLEGFLSLSSSYVWNPCSDCTNSTENVHSHFKETRLCKVVSSDVQWRAI